MSIMNLVLLSSCAMAATALTAQLVSRCDWLWKAPRMNTTGPDEYGAFVTTRGKAHVTRDLAAHAAARAKIGLVVGDHERVYWANAAAVAALGHSLPAMREVPFRSLVHPDDLLISEKVYRTSLSRGFGVTSFVNRWVAEDGSVRQLEWCCTPYDESGLATCEVKLLAEHPKEVT